ncbi:sigma-70 family RNA polymerase sigma factor [Pseudenhygromyxa sp. WMMC2535]|uniref:RNA polymerase sigma factor n=1 Tax=Pseudenhygromyxa sp. WMMC2535 TaxID=2712867 RepID=UPI001553C959|nr:sigma-70 family RNA polymerase sigma factor [Pseudenhygromyxa sp. WMMC2535]NVB40225.1 sigma-70 family RNA polymerase sigma factor [Pseudenhygromyxa sp. WMMC2535]
MDREDFELLQQWVEGERRAGDRLVKRYHKGIARFFMNAVGDQERRDLTNETFMRLCSARHRFSGRSSFRSFLYGIARNVLNEFLRQKYRDGEFDPQLHTIEDTGQLSISRLISELVRKEVAMKCLRELPVETKQMMELYYWHDMTADELGQMYGVPAATVRTRLHSARKQLQKMIAKHQPDISSLDIDQQLETLRRLLGFGPQKMDEQAGE